MIHIIIEQKFQSYRLISEYATKAGKDVDEEIKRIEEIIVISANKSTASSMQSKIEFTLKMGEKIDQYSIDYQISKEEANLRIHDLVLQAANDLFTDNDLFNKQ